MTDRAEMNPGDSQYRSTPQAFRVALADLMRLHGVKVDHNHDAESLTSGWHFRFPNGGELYLAEMYERET